IIRFTNGLTVYMSGDTAIHADMKTVIGDFHKPNLALMNYGASATDAKALSQAVNDLIRPAAVIMTHVNEAATTGGKLKPPSRTAAFAKMVRGNRPVYLAVSERTMEFDGDARCVSGCQ